MAKVVFNLTIEDCGENHCRIFADYNSSSREIEVEKLKPSFRQNLRPLQEAILQSSGARSAEVALRPRYENAGAADGGDEARPAIRDAAGSLTAGSDERIVQEVGSQLFDFIFQRKILELYQECSQAARRDDEPFLIRLRVSDSTLAYVPWETMYDKKNRFYVTTSQSTPFTRAVDDYGEERRMCAARPIRMLGMAARVKVLNGFPLDEIEVDAEQVAIKNALSELNDGKRLKLSWIPSAKARDLNRRFLRGDEGKRWDLFHFIGHGGHDPDRQMGFVVVQEEGGSRGARLYADALKTFLTQPGQTPSLVVLNSCSGAQGEPGSLFSSTAAELIQGGVPAVIAMQFEISDNMGLAFADTFYTYLADNVSIQAALAHTRAELKARQFAEWISPVLYMRGLDGEIFVDRAGS
ncbi:CHAT domain-containing protein [Bradyrhizobium sp. NAS80.1]|uniref:CHAT domain-containing protein n=1 Tax=Bradyrhizobium sp. NAS80.1 TaxID=1680159 RepID=UPI000A6B0837|nr:CHAT domain-containing protein [Bradyrhizobium sp. NAS80.1]